MVNRLDGSSQAVFRIGKRNISAKQYQGIVTTVLETDVVDFLVVLLPPAKTILLLEPLFVQQGDAPDVLTLAITDSLCTRSYGITVVDADQPASTDIQTISFRYLVSPLDNGLMLRLQFKGQERGSEIVSAHRTITGALLTSVPFLLWKAESSDL